MTIQVGTTDARTAKALELLSGADRWLKITRKRDGRRFYVVPSSDGQRLYWTNLTECNCPDFIGRGGRCKHMLAVALHVARVDAERNPGRTPCAGCAGISAYHKARCDRSERRVRVPPVGRLAA